MKKRGWRKKGGEIKNLELWKELDKLVVIQEDLKIVKVKAHTGIKGNEIADMLANKGMDEIEKENRQTKKKI